MIARIYGSHRNANALRRIVKASVAIAMAFLCVCDNRVLAEEVSHVDEETRWEFAALSFPAVDSAIIRVGDVIRPIHRDLAAWPRLSAAPVGLMPVDGSLAKISRDRLAQLIEGAEATPTNIRIHGPETIGVRRRTSDSAPSVAYQTTSQEHLIDRVSRPTNGPSTNGPSVQRAAYVAEKTSSLGHAESQTLTHAERQRIEQWIRIGIRNQFKDIHDSFAIEIDWPKSRPGTLVSMQGISDFEFVPAVPVWTKDSTTQVQTQVVVHGRSIVDDCSGALILNLKPYPSVVVANQSLRRGYRVKDHDLRYAPFSTEKVSLPANAVVAMDEIAGLEVVGLVRGGVPLSASDFAAPRVIRRGDLLEVEVGAGGVRVTTNAKALGDGARGELIEIETLQPKRRLLAKVVDSSLVQVMTQPTRVRATSGTGELN